MKLSLSITSFLALATILTCAAGDGLSALKATLLSLCAANENGVFGNCCLDNNNGQDIAAISDLPACFGKVTTTKAGDEISMLFVLNLIRFFFERAGNSLATSRANS